MSAISFHQTTRTQVAAAAVFLACSTFGNQASAGANTALVCHRHGDGSLVSLAVAASAVPAHIRHGDASFTGSWASDQAELVTTGTQVSGTWNVGSRPPFSGALLDGCTVSMNFPDDATYRGTLVSACKIQWSYPNSDLTDPNNFWILDDSGCQ